MQKIMIGLLVIISLQNCRQGFGLVKSEKLREWKNGEYTIVYAKKLGPAGPPYYQYDIYKSGKFLSYDAYLADQDTCHLIFSERIDYYVRFNLCNGTRTILTDVKAKLDCDDIDSVTIRPYDSIKVEGRNTYTAPFFDTMITRNFDSTNRKQLRRADITTFCKRWNKAGVNGYEKLGKSYDYLITVYTKTGVRRFKTYNFYITENDLWSYETKEDEFYDKLWLGKR